MTDSLGAIFLNAARDLERAERELRGEDLRTLYVVESRALDGSWFARPGDAYLDRGDAERAMRATEMESRIVVYRPEAT